MHYDEIITEGLNSLRKANVPERWLDIGAETQHGNKLNREYIESITFEMRLLGSTFADTTSSIFGVRLPAPIMPATFMHGRVWDKMVQSGIWNERSSFSFTGDYLEDIAAGVADAQSIAWIGADNESESVARMIESGVKVVLIVKPLKNKEKVKSLMKWGEKLGCVAV